MWRLSLTLLLYGWLLLEFWRGRRGWLPTAFEVLFAAMFAPVWFNSWFVIWPPKVHLLAVPAIFGPPLVLTLWPFGTQRAARRPAEREVLDAATT